MAGHPLRPATHRRLGRPLPRQLANGTQVHLMARSQRIMTAFNSFEINKKASSGISYGFPKLSPSIRQVTYALLTRSPVYSQTEVRFPLNLHVLSTPPAFVLSQDQTLRCLISYSQIKKLKKSLSHASIYKEQSAKIAATIITNFTP